MNTPTRPTALKYGLILGIASSIYSIFLYFANLSTSTGFAYLSFGITIGVVVLAIREYLSLNGGFMSLKEGFRVGFVTSLIGGVISSVVSVVYTMIDKQAIAQVLDETRMKLEENPQMTDEIIEMSMSWTESLMKPFPMLMIGIISSAIGGAILSLIIAAIMKKDDPGYNSIDEMGDGYTE